MFEEIQVPGFLNLVNKNRTYFCSNILYLEMELEHLTYFVYTNCLHKPGVSKPWHNPSAGQNIILFYNIFNESNVINFIVKVFENNISSSS